MLSEEKPFFANFSRQKSLKVFRVAEENCNTLRGIPEADVGARVKRFLVWVA